MAFPGGGAIDEAEEKTFEGVMKNFMASASIHGIGRVNRNTSWVRRTVWGLVFLAFLVWAICQISLMVLDYKDFPKIITRQSVTQSEAEFPAVTICPVVEIPRSEALLRHPLLGPLVSFDYCSEEGRDNACRPIEESTERRRNKNEKEEEETKEEHRKTASEVGTREVVPWKPSVTPQYVLECLPGMFRCDDGTCIVSRSLCNGIKDCRNEEDERACCGCPDHQFRCKNGICYPEYERCRICNQEQCEICDRVNDCVNGVQPCGEGYYQCQNGDCISDFFVCDTIKDCRGGDDERNCTVCKEGILCNTGECIPYIHRCDTYANCPKGEDEKNCDTCRDGLLCDTKDCIDLELQCGALMPCNGTWCETCKEGDYMCETGQCIASYQRCDFVPDCPHSEDEYECEDKYDFLCKAGDFFYKCICNGYEDCPGGEDEQDCDQSFATGNCRYGFRCHTGECISALYRCNMHPECPNGEDEENCLTCRMGFLCKNGRCVGPYPKCNGVDDCGDEEDEKECDCSNRFVCKTGECILFSAWCNNVTDCPNGEDEQDCDRCPEGTFRCKSGECILGSKRCDKQRDCPQGEDEECSPMEYIDIHRCDGVQEGLLDSETDCEECHLEAFRCQESTCIERHSVCNGMVDCRGGEDELNCNDSNTQCSPGYLRCGSYCLTLKEICSGELRFCRVDIRLLCVGQVLKDPAHEVRLTCSDHYRALVSMVGLPTAVNESTGISDECPLEEVEFWSDHCQTGIICDRFGCYDNDLQRYVLDISDNIICRGKKARQLTFTPRSYMVNLALKSLPRKSDLEDLYERFRPSNELKKEFEVKSEQLLYSCAFGNQECNHRNFTSWTSGTYGMCHTFNVFPLNNKNDILKVFEAGPRTGLHLTLNIPLDLALFSQETDIKLMIHNPHQVPVPEEEGVNLGPGNVYVSVTRTETLLEGSCSHKFDIDIPFEYSPKVCRQMCKERAMRQRCGCFMDQSPVLELLKEKPDQFCEGRLSKQSLCMKLVEKDFTEKKIHCDCPPSCREMTYQTHITTSKIEEMHYKVLHSTRKSVPSVQTNDTKLLNLQIYLRSLSYDIVKEKPVYTWESLLANIGGSLGLFIGMSFVSVMEVLQLLWDICRLVLQRCTTEY